MSVPSRTLIVNADDFGAASGVNRGIVAGHVGGVVTSTSLMTTGRAVEDAAALAAGHPALSVGLHWDLDGSSREAPVALEDTAAVRLELERQLEQFQRLLGRPPTHLDSHHHVHLLAEVAPVARELAASLGLPLRRDGRVAYIGGFYGQWEHGVTDLEHLRVDYLISLLRDEVGEGWTELACHPGFVTDDLTSVYLTERETEVATLTDPRVREAIDSLGIRLASYADLPGR